MKTTIPIDTYGFRIVGDVSTLRAAYQAGHRNVKVKCTVCGKEHLVSIMQAAKALADGCKFHTSSFTPKQ